MGNSSSSSIDNKKTELETPYPEARELARKELKERVTSGATLVKQAPLSENNIKANNSYIEFDKFYDKIFALLVRSDLIDRDIAEEAIQYVNLYQTIDDEHEGYLTEAHKISDYNIREYNERNRVAFDEIGKKIIDKINQLNKNPSLQSFINDADISSINSKLLSLSEEKGFGLDSSSVKVEQFPMVLHPPEIIDMKRIDSHRDHH